MRPTRLWPNAVAVGAALAATFRVVVGCGGGARSSLAVVVDAGSDAAPEAGPPPLVTSDKVDLLFVVGNGPNTDAMQALLAATAPYLLERFARPACVDGLGNVVSQTASSTDPCPIGLREFAPVTDVHVGVISTSLGAAGADSCSPALAPYDPTENDAAHLLTRGPSGTVPTWRGQGFLAWDPKGALEPPGLADPTAFGQELAELATGVGDRGCSFPASLESIYRFLVDPEPYASISIINGDAVATGTDEVLLQQRREFLRSDSALVVVLVTDVDDCSVEASGRAYLALTSGTPGDPAVPYHLPPARAACATNPDDPCCASCSAPTPAGCAVDPTCASSALSPIADPITLRCFDPKRRFGVDFRYPIARYVDGLTSPTVASRDGSMVPNPLYTGNRSPELVMVAGIVGVPWQDVTAAPEVLGSGYQVARAIDWTGIVGDADAGPSDPLMIASITPRTGVSPRTGVALAPPDAGTLANPVNGHERVIAAADDLQYACVFPRPTPVACASAPCPCVAPEDEGNPICQAPDGAYAPTETFARALPSTRPLLLLRALGDRATVASVCAANASANTSDAGAAIFAYEPAGDAILRTLRTRLRP